MMTYTKLSPGILPIFLVLILACQPKQTSKDWTIHEEEYLETQGLSILAFHNFYPVGKQGGVEIIQHGERIATNGFIRMERVEGQRLNYPERATREIKKDMNLIKANVSHEDFEFNYSIRVWPEEDQIRIAVDLDTPIPAEWENKLSFALEFFPPLYYGKSFQMRRNRSRTIFCRSQRRIGRTHPGDGKPQ